MPALGTGSASTPAHSRRRVRKIEKFVFNGALLIHDLYIHFQRAASSISNPTTLSRLRALPPHLNFAATSRTQPVEVLRIEVMMGDLVCTLHACLYP